MKSKFFIALITFAAAAILVSQNAPFERVGQLPDGGFLLNNGWVLRPAGQQVDVDTFPMRSALSSDGKYLLVLNGGYNPPSISVLDVAGRREISRTPVADAWLGLVFSSDNKKVYAGGGSKARVYEFKFDPANGTLTPGRELQALSDPANPGHSFIGDVALSGDNRFL